MTTMIETIDESINVLAICSKGQIRPLVFSWRNRRYENLKVTSTWLEPEGSFKKVFFSVITDGANLYELCFRTRTLEWLLVRIYHD